ncbi:hypothetical protein L9F63_001348, partial [Diploptera punctata]
MCDTVYRHEAGVEVKRHFNPPAQAWIRSESDCFKGFKSTQPSQETSFICNGPTMVGTGAATPRYLSYPVTGIAISR